MQFLRPARWVAASSLTLCLLILAVVPARADEPPQMRDADRIRIAEAFRLADAVQEKVWSGWSHAPFALLLVTPQTEFLLHHPNPPADFARAGEDAALGGAIYARKRVFQTALLATFPINGVSTIVVGQAENTDAKTSTRWVVTLLHEHFHQLQYSQPDYQEWVNRLGLARGDSSGMWMLNYEFPYAKPEVRAHFNALCRRLSETVSARAAGLPSKLAGYRQARAAFSAAVLDDDDRYFSFQLWQEGVARYVELRTAEIAARDYQPSEAFRNLPDYRSFDEVARDFRSETRQQLTRLRLGESKRVMFYYVGANLALLLDRARPDWKSHYFDGKLALDWLLIPAKS